VGTKRKSDGDQEFVERQAMICKAFANPTRLHLMEMLMRGERWAAELQQGLGISKAKPFTAPRSPKIGGCRVNPARRQAAALRTGRA
jgi:hypothetical protein